MELSESPRDYRHAEPQIDLRRRTEAVAAKRRTLPLGGAVPEDYCFEEVADSGGEVSAKAPSIFAQIPSWKAYEESMPTNCDHKNVGEYAVRHNPPPYYTTLSECATKDVPYTQLAGDLAGGTLPAFSFITPNVIDDMHDGTIAQGNARSLRLGARAADHDGLQAGAPTAISPGTRPCGRCEARRAGA